MHRMLGVLALGFAGTIGGLVPARAQVPLAVVDPAGALPTLAPVLRKASPAVVGIMVETHGADGQGAAAKSRRSPKAATQHEDTRAGSGVIFDAAQGLIVTNNHVIEHGRGITVTLVRGRRVEATLVGADPDTDVAVLKVQMQDLTAISFRDSGQLQAGDFVIAIGIPFPLGRTTTLGIISGLHRSAVGLARAEDFIQTDAAIYPGDSGGALVDLRGDLVGINSGYIGSTPTNPGVGFAIPSNLVRRVVDEILTHGGVRRGTLGISFADPNGSSTRDTKLAVPRPVIDKVDAGSAAERVGLKAGDVVTAIDGVAVRTADELYSKLGLDWLGDPVELTVSRGGQTIVVHPATEGAGHARSR